MIKIKIMRMVSTGLMMTTTTVRIITMIRDDDGADNAIMTMLMKMMMLKMIIGHSRSNFLLGNAYIWPPREGPATPPARG